MQMIKLGRNLVIAWVMMSRDSHIRTWTAVVSSSIAWNVTLSIIYVLKSYSYIFSTNSHLRTWGLVT